MVNNGKLWYGSRCVLEHKLMKNHGFAGGIQFLRVTAVQLFLYIYVSVVAITYINSLCVVDQWLG